MYWYFSKTESVYLYPTTNSDQAADSNFCGLVFIGLTSVTDLCFFFFFNWVTTPLIKNPKQLRRIIRQFLSYFIYHNILLWYVVIKYLRITLHIFFFKWIPLKSSKIFFLSLPMLLIWTIPCKDKLYHSMFGLCALQNCLVI